MIHSHAARRLLPGKCCGLCFSHVSLIMLEGDITIIKTMKHPISPLLAERAADPLWPYTCEPLLSRTMIVG